MLASDADRRFLRALRPGRAETMVWEIAKREGWSEGQVRSRAARLKDRDLIEATRGAGFAFYRLTDKGRRVLRGAG